MQTIMAHAPGIFYTSPTLELAFKASIPAMSTVYNAIVDVALDLFRDILAEAFDPNTRAFPSQPTSQMVINLAFQQSGLELLGAVLQGVVGDFLEEKTGTVVSIMRSALKVWPQQVIEALPQILQSIPNAKAPPDAKEQFLTEMTR